MNLAAVLSIVQGLGGLLAALVLAVLFYGIWRGSRRQVGRSSGRAQLWLRSYLFYLLASAVFFIPCVLLWHPMAPAPAETAQAGLLVVGALFYFAGMLLMLWARLTLGRNYYVSTALGAQLFAGHQLITSGPYAFVRHPMYSGLVLAALGGLALYLTWTTLMLACMAPMLFLRARREEKVLAAEFGEQWQAYCRQVSPFFPKLRR